MKKEKLQDAIGMIGDDLVKEAQKKPEPARSTKIKWIAVVAAMLSFVIVLGVVMRPTKPTVENKAEMQLSENVSASLTVDPDLFVLTKAKYPERCQNPGIMGESIDLEAYDLWDEERREYLSAYNQRTPDLSSFIENSIPAFMEGKEGNVIYSPINVYMALALLGETSQGESRAQILNALGCDSIEDMRADANAIWKALYNDDGVAKTILANSLWLRDGAEYNEETLDILASNYYASAYRGKMGSEEYNGALRGWLNEQTDDMLTDQINGLSFDPETVLAMASTLLFNAKWSDKFDPELTEKGVFHSYEGDMDCEYMKDSSNGYLFIGEEFTSVRKNFVDAGHMMLVLPEEGVTPEELIVTDEFADFVNCGGRESTMVEYTDKVCWKKDKYAIINLSMPKFDVSSQIELTEGLGELGITDIIDETKADMSAITDDRAFVSKMVHGARVTADEEGCTAASFVLTLCGATSAPLDVVDFTLDRPFIFVIAGFDGLPLYIGIVNSVN